MKKLILMGTLVLSLVSFSGSAFAAGYGDAGCGLGSLAFGNQQGGIQVLASTTNGTFGTQTFGITTGTSNCNPAGLVKLEKEREEFAKDNYSTLVKEMAMGEGENLDTWRVSTAAPRIPMRSSVLWFKRTSALSLKTTRPLLRKCFPA